MSRQRRRRTDRGAFLYTGKGKHTKRVGERCRIVERSSVAEVVMVEFDDGGRYLVSRRALARPDEP